MQDAYYIMQRTNWAIWRTGASGSRFLTMWTGSPWWQDLRVGPLCSASFDYVTRSLDALEFA